MVVWPIWYHVEQEPGMTDEFWTLEAVDRLVALAKGGATADVISMKLGLDVADVEAKLADLGIVPGKEPKPKETSPPPQQ